jgi:CheY-like chemotaxis protein
MDEETRRRCLDPFFTTMGDRGTGMGLSMVFGMAQRHGAELEIESTLGAGTTMRMIFPAASAAAAAPEGQGPSASPRGLRILTIDDDPLILAALRVALECDDHIVISAEGGQAGIDAFRTAIQHGESYAVVITDLGMPTVDGRKVAAAIKAQSPDTPVILLTGWGQPLMALNDLPTNVDCVLGKPPRLQQMRAALASLMARTSG